MGLRSLSFSRDVATAVWRAALTLAIGGVGAAAASWAGLPAALIAGPAVSVALACVMGTPLDIPVRLRDVCFVIIGVSLASGVTSDTFAAAARWPFSFVMLIAVIALMIEIVRRILTRWFGYDDLTALLASIPGHLSYVLAMSMERGADTRTVAVAQSVRVMGLTLLAPALIQMIGAPSDAPAPAVLSSEVLTVLIAVAAAGGAIFKRLNIAAAYLLGAMAFTMPAFALDWAVGAPPDWLRVPGFVAMGSLLGVRFAGVTLRELRQSAVVGAVITVVGAGAAMGAALSVAAALHIAPSHALLAFAPGALEAMAAMALTLGADPAYVAGSHVFRLIFLSFYVPWLVRRVRRAAAT